MSGEGDEGEVTGEATPDTEAPLVAAEAPIEPIEETAEATEADDEETEPEPEVASMEEAPEGAEEGADEEQITLGTFFEDPKKGWRVFRYICDCKKIGCACYERGGYQYIYVIEKDVEKKQIAFDIPVLKVKQKSREYYMGAASARKIDLASLVPQIQDHRLHSEIAKDLREKPDGDFQRKLERQRMDEIGQFWAKRDNNIINAVSLASTGDENVCEINPLHDGDSEFCAARVTPGNWISHVCETCELPVKDAIKDILDNTNSFCEGQGVDKSIEHTEAQRFKRVESLKDMVYAIGYGEDYEKFIEDYASRIRSDYCLNPNCEKGHGRGIRSSKRRALVALDGQHRIRGTQQGRAQSEERHPSRYQDSNEWGFEGAFGLNCPDQKEDCFDGCTCEVTEENLHYRIPSTVETIPFTLLPGEEFDVKAQGKLFTDITVEAKPMSKLHKVYMIWKYRLNRQIAVNWPPKLESTNIVRGQRFDFTEENKSFYKAYTTALYLADDPFMKDRVPIVGGSVKRHWISLEWFLGLLEYQWGHFCRGYEEEDGKVTEASYPNIVKGISNYFKAYEAVTSEMYPGATLPHWSKDSEKKGHVSGLDKPRPPDDAETTIQFKMMFSLMSDVFWEAAALQYWTSENPSMNTFLTNIGFATTGLRQEDWDDSDRFKLLRAPGTHPHEIQQEHLETVLRRCSWPFENLSVDKLYGSEVPHPLPTLLSELRVLSRIFIGPTGVGAEWVKENTIQSAMQDEIDFFSGIEVSLLPPDEIIPVAGEEETQNQGTGDPDD